MSGDTEDCERVKGQVMTKDEEKQRRHRAQVQTAKAKYRIARALGATYDEAYEARAFGWVRFCKAFLDWDEDNAPRAKNP